MPSLKGQDLEELARAAAEDARAEDVAQRFLDAIRRLLGFERRDRQRTRQISDVLDDAAKKITRTLDTEEQHRDT